MFDITGHILTKVVLNEDEQTLSLTLDGDKIFLVRVEGDCCSHGKLIGATSEDYLELPSKITEIKERREAFETNENAYKVYEDTFVLENGGAFVVVYDNMSNGYYGSSLEAYYNNAQCWEFPK